jgi:nucleotide-binding universal stress UspA family protein
MPPRAPSRSAIVCGVDRSPESRSAARLAILLSRRLRRPLELVHVVEPGATPVSQGGMTALQAVLEEQLDVAGIGVRLQSGSVASVLAHVGRHSRLLVIGNRGEGAARRALFGSVSAALTGDPPCPTIVVPAGAGEGLAGRTILCAVRDERDAFAAHASAKLASVLGHTLTVAHVIPRATAQPAGGAPPGPALTKPAAVHREDALRMLDRIARPIAAGLACEIELRVPAGAPGPQLDRLAAAERASMVAVSASHRGPLSAALAGVPSSHLIRHGERPVIVYPRARQARSIRPYGGEPAASAFAWQQRT